MMMKGVTSEPTSDDRTPEMSESDNSVNPKLTNKGSGDTREINE